MKRKFVYCIFFVFGCFSCDARECFKSMQEAWEVANRYIDFPPSDDRNWLDPVFTSFYDSVQPGFFKKIALWFHVGENDWDFSGLKPVLKRVTKQLLTGKKIVHPSLQTLSVKNECIGICGPLYGSFRSLLRNLGKMKEQQLIDDQFVLKNKSIYLVILGGVVGISPYSFHLLQLILTLMDKNPGQIIYIRGDQERYSHWKDLNVMRYPLDLLAGSVKTRLDDIVPLEKELNAFFDALPDTLCFEYQGPEHDKMYCAANAVNQEFLRDPKTSIVFLGEQRADVLWKTRGLAFIRFDGNAATWSLISCPNRTYRDHFDFNFDNFILMHVDGPFIDSMFSFFSRDVRTKKPFIEERYYGGLGLRLSANEQRKKIPVVSFGSTMTLSGAVRAVGRGLRQGIEAAFMRQNEQGGVHGYFIKPVILDDQYVPRFARINVEHLLKDFGITILVCPQGTPTLDSYIDLVRNGNVFVFFPSTGGNQFRSPDLLNLVNHRLPYQYEIRALMNFLATEFRIKQYALIYAEDSLGLQFMKEAHDTLEKYGVKTITDIPYSNGQTEFGEQIQKLLAANPDGIGFFFTSSTMARNFLSSVGTAFFVGKHLAAVSFLEDKIFRLYLQNSGIRCSFSFAVPDPRSREGVFMEEYRAELDKKNITPDSNSLEGYLAASYFIEALKGVGLPFTGERIMGYIENLKTPLLKDFFGGMFDRSTRTLRFPIWIRTEDLKWILIDNGLSGRAKVQP